MKTLLVIHTSNQLSGAELSMGTLLNGLDRSKFKIVLALPDKSEKIKGLIPQGICEKVNFIWINRSYNPFYLLHIALNIIISSFQVSGLIRQHKADIIIANSFKALPYAILVKLLTGKPVIWFVRDNVSSLVKNLDRFCDRVITVSHYIARQFSDKVNVVYPAINFKKIEHCTPVKYNLRKRIGLPEDVRLVAQVGQLIPWKNHNAFIHAAEIVLREVNNVHFVIVGDDLFDRHKKYVNELQRLITEKGLKSRFSFTGFVDDINLLINEIDILIHPAESEPFGRVIIESMAHKKAVIAIKSGAPSEIIENGVNGFLVDAGNNEEIARNALKLLRDDEMRNQIGARAHEYVKNNFDCSKPNQQVEKILMNI